MYVDDISLAVTGKNMDDVIETINVVDKYLAIILLLI